MIEGDKPDAALAEIIAAWSKLDDDAKGAIVAIAWDSFQDACASCAPSARAIRRKVVRVQLYDFRLSNARERSSVQDLT